jgi:outer membrane lipoprotein SlyB
MPVPRLGAATHSSAATDAAFCRHATATPCSISLGDTSGNTVNTTLGYGCLVASARMLLSGITGVNMTLNDTRNLWIGTLVLAGIGALISACGPQDDASASKTALAAPVVAPAPAPVADPAPAVAESPPPVAKPTPPPAVKPAPVHAARPAPKPVAVKAEPKAEVIKVAAAPPANTVGAVQRIDPIVEADTTGVGAVAGGALGGVLGHQFGKGKGKTAMTVLGAVGGAVAGHQVEKAHNTKVVGYRVQVQLDNGETRTFEPTQIDGLKVGDRVRIDQGQLLRV